MGVEWTATWPTPEEVKAYSSPPSGAIRRGYARRWFYGYTSQPATYREDLPELRIAKLSIDGSGNVLVTGPDFMYQKNTYILWGPWVDTPPPPPERRLEETGLKPWVCTDWSGGAKKATRVWAVEAPDKWGIAPYEWEE